MILNIDEKNLKEGVLGLVLALVEIIRDALRTQALKRMTSGGLTETETDRLGAALMDLDLAIENIKEEQGVAEVTRSVRDGLDEMVNELACKMFEEADPEDAIPLG